MEADTQVIREVADMVNSRGYSAVGWGVQYLHALEVAEGKDVLVGTALL